MGDDQKVGHGRFDPYLGKLEKTGLEGITAQAKEISRLRNRLAQIERQVRELADELREEMDAHNQMRSFQEYEGGRIDKACSIEERLRAIIDPLDKEDQ